MFLLINSAISVKVKSRFYAGSESVTESESIPIAIPTPALYFCLITCGTLLKLTLRFANHSSIAATLAGCCFHFEKPVQRQHGDAARQIVAAILPRQNLDLHVRIDHPA